MKGKTLMANKTSVFFLLSSVLLLPGLLAAAQPCRDIRFKPLEAGLMRYGDTTRLGPDHPFVKDPTVIRHNGKYFMYYSECGYAKGRAPKHLPKYRTWWWGAIATSTNLVDWTRVGSIAVEGAPKTVGWVAP